MVKILNINKEKLRVVYGPGKFNETSFVGTDVQHDGTNVTIINDFDPNFKDVVVAYADINPTYPVHSTIEELVDILRCWIIEGTSGTRYEDSLWAPSTCNVLHAYDGDLYWQGQQVTSKEHIFEEHFILSGLASNIYKGWAYNASSGGAVVAVQGSLEHPGVMRLNNGGTGSASKGTTTNSFLRAGGTTSSNSQIRITEGKIEFDCLVRFTSFTVDDLTYRFNYSWGLEDLSTSFPKAGPAFFAVDTNLFNGIPAGQFHIVLGATVTQLPLNLADVDNTKFYRFTIVIDNPGGEIRVYIDNELVLARATSILGAFWQNAFTNGPFFSIWRRTTDVTTIPHFFDIDWCKLKVTAKSNELPKLI